MKMRLPIKLYFWNTSIFIADRLKLITQELDGVEQDVQSFKKIQLTDIESEAKLL
jgi:hypothetical protein